MSGSGTDTSGLGSLQAGLLSSDQANASGGGSGLGSILGGLFGGGGGSGGTSGTSSSNVGQYLGLVQQLLKPGPQTNFGGSFIGGTRGAAGQTVPLQFGASAVGKDYTPGERLALLMGSLGGK